MNDGIATDLSSLCYTSVDHLCSIILSVGKGAQLVRTDIKRTVPVHPYDHPLLAVEWANRVYINRVLPFGLRSALKSFRLLQMPSSESSTIMEILISYITWTTLFIAKTSADAEAHKCTLVNTWNSLGVPLELSKLEGPATYLTFLGIEIDTINMQARLPSEKLSGIQKS